MMGVALEEAVKTAMRNHVYTFNGEVRRQSEGGAIGNKLTGAMAKVYMSRWTGRGAGGHVPPPPPPIFEKL